MTNFKEDLGRVKAFVFDIDGVMSLQTISLNAFGVPNRTVNLRDGYAIQLAVKKGYRVAVISGSNAKEYIKRLKLLGVRDIYLNSRSKVEHFKSFLNKYNIQKSDVLFMGDDIPDYGVMRLAGIPVCPADADSEIRQVALYISDKRGGEGCVRDVIEQVLRLHNNWMDNDAFSW
ncbi:MAG TPA: 3-deoxy-D-manno-octulosonate 8-phosphate phosphatase [Bacteroidales bacterium]|jgi:3-deoxy-D-manno-octulosonate 8-phosphate phosphatase (KDO 8-P phosphatase)|nr:3-deoxy-D-manno-octulosonate 8-phosphate phosphatase [Bacteroidales bacterium]HBZ20725.1 3-deoxy-D-manno-octulosonate 8-phosphate phosphatase [Bacteroidales bacterium]